MSDAFKKVYHRVHEHQVGVLMRLWGADMSRAAYDKVDPGFKRLVGFDTADDPRFASALMSVLGTLGDVANYALMGICLLAAMFPEEYDAWKAETDNED